MDRSTRYQARVIRTLEAENEGMKQEFAKWQKLATAASRVLRTSALRPRFAKDTDDDMPADGVAIAAASITPKLVAHTQALTTGFDGVVKVIEAQNDKMDALGSTTVRVAATLEKWHAHAVRETIGQGDLVVFEGFTRDLIVDFLDVARESGYIEFSVGAFCSIKKELAVALCVYIKSRAPAMEPTVKVAGEVFVQHLQAIRNAAGGSVTNKFAEAHPARAYNPAKGRFRDVLNCWQITTIPAVVAFASPAPAYASAPASEPSMEIDVVDSDGERDDPSYSEH
ncbi:hypothetical protein HDU87_007323 [Geranomyces variabilis]|uniref:Uncharacterized protein n=1 Tax=Geranomyces variabilis TaxID=109894 RepID=A0AAD5TF95_9FUNG|nr:hypothetical protein HDU87_007323 [Geranomyces variabilis]